MDNPFAKPHYLEKLGLKEPPYSTNPDERYLFLTDIHQEAIHMCGSLITGREGAGLIVGEQGTGKTTIMRRLYSLMKSTGEYNIAIIETAEHCPTVFQLTKEILESFGEECVGRDTKTRIDQLKEYLLNSFREGKTCVLLIDEAQQMKGHILESLRGLLNFEDSVGGKMLQIILFAMPGINRKFRYAPSLRNRIVRTELRRMTQAEMESMLRWRFTQAGGVAFPFVPHALDYLYTVSKGNPRTVCGVAQVALEYAGPTGQPITPDVIDIVAHRRLLD
ncbi:MAG: ExeA family protein [Caldilineaceae bacterium]